MLFSLTPLPLSQKSVSTNHLWTAMDQHLTYEMSNIDGFEREDDNEARENIGYTLDQRRRAALADVDNATFSSVLSSPFDPCEGD